MTRTTIVHAEYGEEIEEAEADIEVDAPVDQGDDPYQKSRTGEDRDLRPLSLTEIHCGDTPFRFYEQFKAGPTGIIKR